MKKISLIITVLFAILIGGCETNVPTSKTGTVIEGCPLTIYVIDNCEYIGNIYGVNSDIITHKGNCKFCAERNKK